MLNQKCIRDGFLDFQHLKYTNEQSKPIPDWALLQPGDVVITSTGRGTIGRSALVTEDGRITCDSHVTIVRPDPEKIVPRFLAAVLSQRKSELEALATGSTNQTELNRASIGSFVIPLPPKLMQRRIADLAVALDVALGSARSSLDALERLLTARVDQIVGQIEAPFEALAEVAEVRSGLAKGRTPKDDPIEVPFLRAANVQDGHLALEDMHTIAVSPRDATRYALSPGDVLLVEGSGSPARLGTGWVWAGEVPGCIHQNHVFAVRPGERLYPRWVAYWILSGHARRYFRSCVKTSSGLVTINKKQVGALPVAIPAREVQENLVASLDRVLDARSALQTKIDALARLRASALESIIQEAHTFPAPRDRLLSGEEAALAAV